MQHTSPEFCRAILMHQGTERKQDKKSAIVLKLPISDRAPEAERVLDLA